MLLGIVIVLSGAFPALAQQASAAGDSIATARSLLDSGDLEAAAASLEAIIGQTPSSGEAHRLLAEVRERQGREDAARAARRKAYDLGVREPRMLRLLGRDLISEHAFGLAARVLEEADALEPLPLGARRGLALALAQAERYEDAVNQLSVLLALEPEDRALRSARARAEIVLGHEQAALVDLDILLGETPKDAETQLMRGKVLARMGRFPEAIQTFETVLSLNPPPDARSIAQADIGSARGQMGDPEAAEEAYRLAIHTDPGNVIAVANLADVLGERQGTEKEAERLLRTALTRDPSASLLYYQLGKNLLSQDRVGEAESNLRAAVQRNPGNPRYHYQFALALHRAGKADEAQREMALHEELLKRYRKRSGME